MSWKRLIRHVARWLTGFRNQPGPGSSSSHLPTESADSEALPNRTPPTEAFMPGQVLDNRFRIVRFIARGGMGEVYAADDLRGGGQVALKTIRPARASHPDMLERFRREVENAKQVTSRHVCRVYDLHHHRPNRMPLSESGPPEEVAFLTMELLPGPTLSEIIRRDGRMPLEQALPTIRQIVAGVDAAHSVGIIHRDLKSSNIILAPDAVPGGSPLAKITDFGLARRLPQQEETESSFTRGGPIGTPEYMAPEVRLSARSATKTSDIYSLGVVLYQMVTGRLPQPGSGEDRSAIQRPSRFAPGLPKKWDETILRCLDPDPSRRFRSAAEILSALEGTNGRRTILRKFALIAVLLATIAGYLYFRHARPPDPPQHAGRRSVAVFGFRNLSGQARVADLSNALATGFTDELRAGEDLRVISAEDVMRVKLDLRLPDLESYARDTLARIRDNTGADLVVLGSYLSTGPNQNGAIRLYVVAQDANSGEAIVSLKQDGAENNLRDLISHSVDQLRARLHIGDRSASQERIARSALPANSDALRLYTEGLKKQSIYDDLAARDLFQKAIAIEPSYAPAHAELAEALSNLGYDQEAQREIKKALELSGGLPREQRLLIEGHYHDIHAEWSKAVDTYRSLFAFFPDNSEYGLLLAGVQDARGALETIAALRKLSPPLGTDPRIDLMESKSASSLSDYEQERIAAERAAAGARQRGARSLLAMALQRQAYGAYMLGQPQKAEALYRQSKDLSESLGDRSGVSDCLRGLARLYQNAGNLAAAWKLSSDALEIAIQIGSREGEARSLHLLGRLRLTQRELAESRRLFEKALALWREKNSNLMIGTEQLGLGEVLYRQRDLNGARRALQESLDLFRQVSSKLGELEALDITAELLLSQGDPAAALKIAAYASQVQERIHDDSTLADVLTVTAHIRREQAVFVEARKDYTQACELREKTGQNGGLAEARLARAQLDLDENQPASAEMLARKALAEFEREGRSSDAASARAVLALALLASQKTTSARAAIQPAFELSPHIQDRLAQDLVRTAAARITAATGNPTEARRQLQALIEEDGRLGLVRNRLEAALALGEIESRAGIPGADMRVRGVAAEAREKGLIRIASRATLASPTK